MPVYDSVYKRFREYYAKATPEQKLSILRHALLKPLHLVQGVGDILDMIDPYLLSGLPEKVGAEEFDHWRSSLIESAEEMRAILDALTWDEEVSGPLRRDHK